MQEKQTMFAWAKTLLSIYKYLETVCDAIDNLVVKQGTATRNNVNYYNSTFNCANKIIELTARKRKLINVKILIDDALASLKDDDIRVLVLTYVDLLKSSLISEVMEISIRTYFRKKNIAINKFANALKFLGFNSEKLVTYLQGEEWIVNLFNKNSCNDVNVENTSGFEENSSRIDEYRLLKCIIKDLNSTHVKKSLYS